VGLAYIHNTGFGDFAENAALVALNLLRRAGMNHGLVVDLGCGSGILARKIAAAGYDVLGIGFSAAMLSLARKRAPKGRFRRASFLKAEIPPCIAVKAPSATRIGVGSGRSGRSWRIRQFFA
jgi:2-polyprenyl-3-methyl-5-hydroxy-6-metoxy-1,4-benzoquinol methylase